MSFPAAIRSAALSDARRRLVDRSNIMHYMPQRVEASFRRKHCSNPSLQKRIRVYFALYCKAMRAKALQRRAETMRATLDAMAAGVGGDDDDDVVGMRIDTYTSELRYYQYAQRLDEEHARLMPSLETPLASSIQEPERPALADDDLETLSSHEYASSDSEEDDRHAEESIVPEDYSESDSDCGTERQREVEIEMLGL